MKRTPVVLATNSERVRHVMTMAAAETVTGLAKRSLRKLMRDGKLKGQIKDVTDRNGKKYQRFKPLKFSVYHDVLGYPEHIAMALALGVQAVASDEDEGVAPAASNEKTLRRRVIQSPLSRRSFRNHERDPEEAALRRSIREECAKADRKARGRLEAQKPR